MNVDSLSSTGNLRNATDPLQTSRETCQEHKLIEIKIQQMDHVFVNTLKVKVRDVFRAILRQTEAATRMNTQPAKSTDRAGHYNRKCDCQQCYRDRFPGAGSVQLETTKGTGNKQTAYSETRGKIDTK